MSKNKTVYILGAGFSKPCNTPSQRDIMKRMFEGTKNSDLRKKISNVYNISESDIRSNLFIEDLLTFLDRDIIDSYEKMSGQILTKIEIRSEIIKSMVNLFDKEFKNKKYIKRFAEYICQSNLLKKDSVSIITTNWDILLDKKLYDEICNINKRSEEDKNKCNLDYTGYCIGLNKKENNMPGLVAVTKRRRNIKLIKLHGSFNWLQCPKCGRIYINWTKKIAANDSVCRLCGDECKLKPIIILPSFIRSYNNPQLKILWQNAGIEITEAKKIVFIGYSFPLDDNELRNLMFRCKGNDKKVEVVLKDKKEKNCELEQRYKSIFGQNNVDFKYIGVESYVSSLTQ